ncbi:hypothetical protein EDB19DRAFT_1833852 [Suillus lakei]|nr:hypothetical protein EDB19DRAFT_1833852 [Suillus lakei]
MRAVGQRTWEVLQRRAARGGVQRKAGAVVRDGMDVNRLMKLVDELGENEGMGGYEMGGQNPDAEDVIVICFGANRERPRGCRACEGQGGRRDAEAETGMSNIEQWTCEYGSEVLRDDELGVEGAHECSIGQCKLSNFVRVTVMEWGQSFGPLATMIRMSPLQEAIELKARRWKDEKVAPHLRFQLDSFKPLVEFPVVKIQSTCVDEGSRTKMDENGGKLKGGCTKKRWGVIQRIERGTEGSRNESYDERVVMRFDVIRKREKKEHEAH